MKGLRSSSILAVVAAVAGWSMLVLSLLTAALAGSQTGVIALFVSALACGTISVGLAAAGISRDRSAVGAPFALLGLLLGGGLLLACIVLWTH